MEKILSFVTTVLSQASAHGRLQLTQEQWGVGAYTEEPMSLHSATILPVLQCFFLTLQGLISSCKLYLNFIGRTIQVDRRMAQGR